jgi:hypothetical protein
VGRSHVPWPRSPVVAGHVISKSPISKAAHSTFRHTRAFSGRTGALCSLGEEVWVCVLLAVSPLWVVFQLSPNRLLELGQGMTLSTLPLTHLYMTDLDDVSPCS